MTLINRIKRRHQINRTIRELSDLSDETLKDIGIERGNIAKLVENRMRKNAAHLWNKHSAQSEPAHGNYHLATEASV